MKTREFLGQIPELVRRRLPKRLSDFKVVGPYGSLVKLHYGDRAIHYEVWVQRRTNKIEVGLHFEGKTERNSRYLEALIQRFGDIVPALGTEVEPEQWTSSWTRIHCLLPLEELNERLMARVSQLLADMMRALEPLLREVGDLPLRRGDSSGATKAEVE